MEKINSFEIVPLDKPSQYVKPIRINYEQNNQKKIWDAVHSHDSVSILIYNKDQHAVVLVRQFRPVIYLAHLAEQTGSQNTASAPGVCKELPSGALGITTELCAGIIDKDKPWNEIAAEEVWEECGYRVPPEDLYFITKFRANVGLLGAGMAVYFVEVTDSQREGKGGGNEEEGEFIDVIHWPADQLDHLIYDPSVERPSSFLFALVWFQKNKLGTYRQAKGHQHTD